MDAGEASMGALLPHGAVVRQACLRPDHQALAWSRVLHTGLAAIQGAASRRT